MLTTTEVVELFRRTYTGTDWLFEHCRELGAEELHRQLPGFGFPTVHLQLYHLTQAEEFWIDVLSRRAEAVARNHEWQTVDDLAAYQQRTAAATLAYVAGLDDTALATACLYDIDDVQEMFVPQWVLMRLITHAFHHRGQIAAMCRLLGHPVPQDMLDFPLDPT